MPDLDPDKGKTVMPVGIKHIGPRKSKNPNYKFMHFSIWMCDYCDEPLGSEHLIYKHKIYHLECFAIARKEGDNQ